jgi:hypothetical protein
MLLSTRYNQAVSATHHSLQGIIHILPISISPTHRPGLAPFLQLALNSQLLQNRLLQVRRLGVTRPTGLNLPILTHQELLKVPLHPLQACQTRFLFLQPLEQRLGLVAVDLRLAEDREGDAVINLAKRLDVVVGTRLLPAELVAWEAEDDEVIAVCGLDLLVELLESFVLRRETAFGGRVDD